ncbi:ATP-dependent zinc metalloprotease YME1L1 [Ciona intestinalis]
MLSSTTILNPQIISPLVESGLHAARRLNSASKTANKKTKNEDSKVSVPNPQSQLRIPFMPSYLERMMPYTSFLSALKEIQINLPKPHNASKISRIIHANLTHSSTMPWRIQHVRTFKTKRTVVEDEISEQKSSQKSSKTTVDKSAIDDNIQSMLKTYDLPTRTSTLLRLGVEEGIQLAKANEGKKSGFNFKADPLTFLLVFIFLILAFRLYKSVPGRDFFRTADESGIITDVRFEDVCGMDEAKNELEDVVDYLRDPDKFTQLGAKLPKGILLIGPPGTGKTLLAKAVAGESGVPFFYTAGSEFDEMFVGIGASRIRKLFENARKQAPSIIFIDEIDACGSKRTNSSLQPYARQTINQLLQEMDGFTKKEPVIVLGATNTGEVLDKALTRPGRFDTQVQVLLPDIQGRKEIFNLYIGKLDINIDNQLNLDKLAALTIGMTGADISNIVNQAALRAAKLNKQRVDQDDLEYALDKAKMGPELKSRIRSESELRNTAHHEAGHALVAYYTPAAHTIYKATIRQRGPALGHVSLIPEKESEQSLSKAQIIAMMDVSMGGRIAEELLLGKEHVSTGASSDINNATESAYKLVCMYGMSEKLGLMTYDMQHLSQETKRAVEIEVKKLLEKSYEKAKEMIVSKSYEHKLLAEALLRYETVTMDEIKVLLDSKDIHSIENMRLHTKQQKILQKSELEKLKDALAPGLLC